MCQHHARRIVYAHSRKYNFSDHVVALSAGFSFTKVTGPCQQIQNEANHGLCSHRNEINCKMLCNQSYCPCHVACQASWCESATRSNFEWVKQQQGYSTFDMTQLAMIGAETRRVPLDFKSRAAYGILNRVDLGERFELVSLRSYCIIERVIVSSAHDSSGARSSVHILSEVCSMVHVTRAMKLYLRAHS